MITREDAQERVAKGAALLDRERPGWALEIDTGTLDLSHPCCCVLGQLEGSFYSAAAQRWYVNAHGLIDGVVSSSRGFDITGAECRVENYRASYNLLQDAWITAIADRLVETTAPIADVAVTA